MIAAILRLDLQHYIDAMLEFAARIAIQRMIQGQLSSKASHSHLIQLPVLKYLKMTNHHRHHRSPTSAVKSSCIDGLIAAIEAPHSFMQCAPCSLCLPLNQNPAYIRTAAKMKGLCYFAFYGSRRLLAILAPISKVGHAPLRFLVAVHALCLIGLQYAAMNFPSVISILAPLLY